MARKSILTTGQVAKVLHVANRTVSKWFDSGRIKGYRLPGSQDRRFPRAEVERFAAEHGIPPNWEAVDGEKEPAAGSGQAGD